MRDKEIIKSSRKTRQNARKTPKTDMFTTLCRSDLQVECIKELKFHSQRRWRFDYAIPEYKIAIEVEGGVWTQGRHTRPQGFLGDVEKYNTATAMGWRLLRCTPDTLISRETIKLIRDTIATINGTKEDL